MSKIFQYPHNPIPWDGHPQDFTTTAPDTPYLGVFQTETTKRYVFGTRYITWDGRVYRYTYASATVYSYHGAASLADGVVAYTANPVATAAGAMSVTATLASRSEDDLAGGNMVIFDASATNTTYNIGIVGNEATVGSTTKIYLENPIPVATTTSDYHEVFENPFSEVNCSATPDYGYNWWVGVPAVSVSGTGYNVWIQTWGAAYISPGMSVDSPASDARRLCWGSNAALFLETSKTSGQIAGYYMHEGSSSIAGPMIYLMCSC
jgi:hypothetical protein